MDLKRINRIEETFRSSKSSDELFDTFQQAIKIRLSDIGVFKILLANPTLSPDEIKLFTEKLIKEMPGSSFDLLMWTGKVFENHSDYYENINEALLYYKRAISYQPESYEPPLNLLNLYNYEINLPINQNILEVIDKSVSAVNQKSKIYYALAKHYKKCGDLKLEAKYLSLAERSAENERA